MSEPPLAAPSLDAFKAAEDARARPVIRSLFEKAAQRTQRSGAENPLYSLFCGEVLESWTTLSL